MWKQPIFDRVRADVDLIRLDPTNTNTKGALNYFDLNRIEENCEYLMKLLNENGFASSPIVIEVKTNWCLTDIPHIKDINRIRQNILTLKNDMNVGTEYEDIEFSNTLNYIKVNILEKDLFLIKKIIDSCTRELRKCKTFYCGTSGLYAMPDNQKPVGFVKVEQYAGLIYCGEECNL